MVDRSENARNGLFLDSAIKKDRSKQAPSIPRLFSHGRTVRDLRALSGMTQQQLADAIGVTRQTVIAIEFEKYSPSLEVAFRIAHVFAVPLEQVFQYDPPHTKRR